MLHTLSNTFLFPQPQLLLPPTKDKEGKVLHQGVPALSWARPRWQGTARTAGESHRPWRLLQ